LKNKKMVFLRNKKKLHLKIEDLKYYV
jgi:hypothetical protein